MKTTPLFVLKWALNLFVFSPLIAFSDVPSTLYSNDHSVEGITAYASNIHFSICDRDKTRTSIAGYAFDLDLINDVYDCPDLQANIGDSCDDGYSSTENDTVHAFCDCYGTPVNDNCSTATVLACTPDVTHYTGSTFGATGNYPYIPYGSPGSGNPGVWFTISVPEASLVELNTCDGSDFSTDLYVFYGDCDTMYRATEFEGTGFADDTGSLGDCLMNSGGGTLHAEPGKTYYIVIVGEWDLGNYDLEVECAPTDCPDLAMVVENADENGNVLDCFEAGSTYYQKISFTGADSSDVFYIQKYVDEIGFFVEGDGYGLDGPYTSSLTPGPGHPSLVYTAIPDVGSYENCSVIGIGNTATVCSVDNNDCQNAQEVFCSQSVVCTFGGSQLSDWPLPACAMPNAPYVGDVFYALEVDSAQTYALGTDPWVNAAIAVYSGTCDSPEEISCMHYTAYDGMDEQAIFTATFDGTVIIRVMVESLSSFTFDVNCSQDFDCPDLWSNVGDTCDDGNIQTTNDSISEACTCVGIPSPTGYCGSEDFSNLNIKPLSPVVVNGSFQGNNNVTWHYTYGQHGATDSQIPEVDEESLILGSTENGGNIISDTVPGGIGDFSVKLYRTFFSGSRQVELLINGVSQGLSEPFTDYEEHTFEVTGIDMAGDVVIEIRNLSMQDSFHQQIVVDDISWTCYSVDCPELNANIGDSCDDGNQNTVNDTLSEDCTCEGTPSFGSLSGNITWNAACGSREILFEFYNAADLSFAFAKSATMEADGTYNLNSITPGNYWVWLKPVGTLSKVFEDVNLDPGTNTLNPGSFILGDVSGDNFVNLIDVSEINAAFGSGSGDENYNSLADINCDNLVNLLDVSQLNASFGIVGMEVVP